MKSVVVLAALAFTCSAGVGVPPQDESRPAKAAAAKAAANTKSPVIEADVFARRVLATADLVLKRHIDPPTRQAMIAGAMKGLLKAANGQPAIGVSRRVSLASRDEDFLRLLAQAWSDARKSAAISDEELQAAAVDGLLNQVPDKPHRLPPNEAKVQEQIRGNRYVGIGIQIAMKPGDGGQWPVIINPFPRGPARLAGAKPGDVILEVDGTPTQGKSLEQVVQMLRGEEGSRVTVVVQSDGGEEKRTLDMTRGVIPFTSLTGYRRVSEDAWAYRPNPSEPIGYLQLTGILASTLSELRQLAPALEAQDVRALVLDLRNAGSGSGGSQHAALVADELLEECAIGRMVDTNGTVRDYRSGPDCLFRRWPIVVLVNRYTSSESEFLAAALQDNHRAVIVGEHTRGRAFVRSPVELPDGLGAVILRTGILQRADGRPIQRESESDQPDDLAVVFSNQPGPPAAMREESGDGGVRPDHLIPMPLDQLQAWMRWRHEQELPEPPAQGGSTPPADPQLAKALEITRAALNEAAQ